MPLWTEIAIGVFVGFHIMPSLYASVYRYWFIFRAKRLVKKKIDNPDISGPQRI